MTEAELLVDLLQKKGVTKIFGYPGGAGGTLVTSGPGATNAITGIATAFMDSIPLIILTGQVPTDMIGLDSFQEVDIYGMTMSITKHNYIVMKKSDLPRIIDEAFYLRLLVCVILVSLPRIRMPSELKPE